MEKSSPGFRGRRTRTREAHAGGKDITGEGDTGRGLEGRCEKKQDVKECKSVSGGKTVMRLGAQKKKNFCLVLEKKTRKKVSSGRIGVAKAKGRSG